MKHLAGNWGYPTRMMVGPGRISDLPRACRSLDIQRPLIVTDQGLATHAMILEAQNALNQEGRPAAVFSDVKGNPNGQNVTDGLEAYRNHQADGVVAFGGGSALDAGKAIAFMVAQHRPLWDFEDRGDNWKRAVSDGVAPVIAVPTTAGTGSEVGRASVIVNDDTHEKVIIFHPTMMPGIVISDPALTTGLPPHITAATGIDAFTHCFEAYSATSYHPMADGLALEGMRLIANALPRAYADGNDIEARADLLSAASMGAAAFQKGLGAVHGLAHPLGAVFDTHHGLTNAVLLPYVMRYNHAAIKDKCSLLGRILNLSQADFDGVLSWVLRLRDRMGVPHTLTDLGCDPARSAEIAEMAERDPSTGGNPIPVSAKDYEAILEKAYAGDV